MKGKKACGMKKGGKVTSGKSMKCGDGGEGGEMGYAKGGSVKASTHGGKSGTCRGMGKAVKGGSFSGCH